MERLDIVDEMGNPTGETVERGEAHACGIRHRTSHVWILRKIDVDGAVIPENVELLLQKRSPDKDSFPGCYDISSAGHIPAGSGFLDSALRELFEELGISAAPDELIECGRKTLSTDDCFHGKAFHDRQVTRIYILWYGGQVIIPQPEEICALRWLPLLDCMQIVGAGDAGFCVDYEELCMLKRYLNHKTKD